MPDPRPFALDPARWPQTLRWAVLLAGSVFLAALLGAVHLSAAFLLGPMAVAIALASSGGSVKLPRAAFVAAQGVVGVMIASKLPASILPEIVRDWPIFLVGTLSTVLGASALGWAMARSGSLPGTTAIWGSSPGAATVMTLMSDDFGADMRLVAVMQYTRVACCAIAATAVVRLFGVAQPGSVAAISAQPEAGAMIEVAKSLALGIGMAFLGLKLKIPGGGLLLPMAGGLIFGALGFVEITLPQTVLALSYAIVGWGIGMRFSREVLRHTARLLPLIVGSILALIALCAGFAMALVHFAGIEPVTAYLATSPGGADSVAIIAAGTQVDVPFVMAMQIARFLLVLIAGPALARALSRRQLRAR
ncbi:MAG: AbrB family transcriptional regulator [Rhodobacteraceae bacterium]|uniref:AbrB family transcriptional regulator n=1 Tax=Thioclava sp. L04-15 TaxID=1915318 RepID=UPI00099805B9|nr:AbrB family transcriptional regulator [Thioclava sp. L04-15]OOY27615.1 ammonia monooxygenase [Thioclava sp. L04-15]TNE90845.1 MAG: AbrB family transcriptional regulator [Paracoccaceae bacterium]TNF12178.1 MAG: AbrB family transcriptional regulator [Paracoccaceae bacterium]